MNEPKPKSRQCHVVFNEKQTVVLNAFTALHEQEIGFSLSRPDALTLIMVQWIKDHKPKEGNI